MKRIYMAKLRPLDLPIEIRKEPLRSAEALFFDSAKCLPDNWYVLYGVPWYLPRENNSYIEGEADFVIISPETGLIIVEIKGGRIGRDNQGWYTIDRKDEYHRIKNPAEQAANCKHNLLTYIRQNKNFSERFIPAGHMVCFPNICLHDAPNLIEMPKSMQILAEDLNNLKSAILNFTDGNSNYKPLTPAECSLIADILKPNFVCPTRWGVQATRQNVIMDSLTEEQLRIWESIEGNDRISLFGPAGSGKTILAIKLAKRYTAESKKVLILLPSKTLQEYYTVSINSDFVYIANYQTVPQTLHFNPFDIVIIDEAQDISDDNWIELYDVYNIEKSKKLLCIFDSNQRLSVYGRGCPLEKTTELRLTRVIRNTRQIGDFASQFYSGNVNNIIIGPPGLNVQLSTIDDNDNLFELIQKAIHDYVFVDGFNYSDIVVLFGKGDKGKFKRAGNSDCDDGISFRALLNSVGSVYKNPFIIVESVFKYRGLESKVVILTGIDGTESDILNNTCYVGASRARNILHVFAKEQTIEKMKSAKSEIVAV